MSDLEVPLTSAAEDEVADRDDVRLATDPPEVLRPYNLAGVLAAADVHGAVTLCRLAGEKREDALLAAALAIRAPQHGHVCVELSTVADQVTAVEDAPVALDELGWPEPDAWQALLASSPLVSVRPPGTTIPDPATDRPLSLVGDRLYLDRYWRYERRVAEVLRKRAERTVEGVDAAALRSTIERLLPNEEGEHPDRQRIAVATGVLRALTVIAGGPGTGKTYTVARLLAVLHELHPGGRPRVALAAPTGKAADRLTAALRDAAKTVDTSAAVRARLRALEGSTLHRLLGWQPGVHTRFKHDQHHRLPHDVVIVDESSMVDLPMMAKLLVALRPDTQLVIVGDPDQLASVEAGAVLADIVGPTGDQLRKSEPTRATLEAATGEVLDGGSVAPARDDGIDDAVVVLGTVRRYAADSGIAHLAAAVHAGDAGEAIRVLGAGHSDVEWLDVTAEADDRDALHPVRDRVSGVFADVLAAARDGDGASALDALDRVRVLCAHRRGLVGVAGWVPQIERWLTAERGGPDITERWYVGRPVLVTRNEPRLHLFNGDVGVVVRGETGPVVAFRGAAGVRTFGPSRLEDIETVHAMTIHKSQGSQFAHVVVVLPDETSPILSRELLYTAITRAERGVTVVGTEASIRHAIERRVSRVSGLRETLWGEEA